MTFNFCQASSALKRWLLPSPGLGSRLVRGLPRVALWSSVILLVLALGIKGLGAWVDGRLSKRSGDVYALAPKQWIPRGLYGEGIQQNSVWSIRRAFERGARGVEVDFHYDPDRDDFFVAHDYPHIDEMGRRSYTKSGGKELPLADLMSETAERHWFWFDYKNLGHLEDDQTAKALKRLEVVASIHGVKGRAYIEGSDPFLLARYKQAGFRTILGIHPVAERWPGSSLLLDVAKILFWFGGYDGIAMGYGTVENPVFGPSARESLKNVPMFLFHVPPDQKLVKELVALPQVRVMLVGRDISVDLLDLENVSKPLEKGPAQGAQPSIAPDSVRP